MDVDSFKEYLLNYAGNGMKEMKKSLDYLIQFHENSHGDEVFERRVKLSGALSDMVKISKNYPSIMECLTYTGQNTLEEAEFPRLIQDTTYVNWYGNFAKSLNFEIPWIMCGESTNNTINSCNGNYCYGYIASHSSNYLGQPLAWTENERWFQYWGSDASPGYQANETCWVNRSPQDVSFGVHHNYCMYFGGNHQKLSC